MHAVAIIEVGKKLGHRGNTVTIRWTQVEGNEVANDWAKGAAESTAGAIDRLQLRETSLSHPTRATTEAKTQGAKSWIRNRVNRRRGHRFPKGTKLQADIKSEREAPASRYYQFLSRHTATGAYLCNKIGKIPSDNCW